MQGASADLYEVRLRSFAEHLVLRRTISVSRAVSPESQTSHLKVDFG